MKTPIGHLLCLMLVAGAAARSAAAQDTVAATRAQAAMLVAGQGFFGALGDYMHRLSGPAFRGIDADFTCGVMFRCTSPFKTVARERFSTDSRIHWKFSLGYYRSYQKKVDAVPDDTAKITMTTAQIGAEFDPLDRWQFPLRVGSGFTLHYFAGQVDPFVNFSIPVWAYIRTPKLHWGPFSPKFGARSRVFLPFGKNAFKPFAFEEMKRNQFEGLLTYFVGVEFRK